MTAPEARRLIYAATPGQPLSAEKEYVLARIPEAARVLEIGAHAGDFSNAVKGKGCHVTAVEADAYAAAHIGAKASRVIVGNIEHSETTRQIAGAFDVILLMHVLEHLVDPWATLQTLQRHLAPGGRFLILLPNVAAWRIRKELFFRGTFEYEEVGLMDRTHLRFFTIASARELLESVGLHVEAWHPTDVCVPLERRLRLLTGSLSLAARWSDWMIRRYPNLCTEITFFEARVQNA